MMAQDGGKVRLVPLTPGEALALQLGARASAAAGEALRLGGYHATSEQLAQITRELCREAHFAGLALVQAVEAGMTAPTDDELDAAADLSGAAKVAEVLGPPAAAMVN